MKKSLIIQFSLLSLLAATILSCEKQIDPGPVDPGSSGSVVISKVTPDVGQMGNTVVIDGSGFSANPKENFVMFGKVRIAAISGTSQSLVVKIPKDAESSYLRVEVNGDYSLASPKYFTVKQILPLFRGSGDDAIGLENLTSDFVRASSVLILEGSKSIIQHGHVWTPTGGAAQPNSSRQQTELGAVNTGGAEPYEFTSSLDGLQPSTTYSVRPYVTDKGGTTTYGPTSRFTTPKR